MRSFSVTCSSVVARPYAPFEGLGLRQPDLGGRCLDLLLGRRRGHLDRRGGYRDGYRLRRHRDRLGAATGSGATLTATGVATSTIGARGMLTVVPSGSDALSLGLGCGRTASTRGSSSLGTGANTGALLRRG